MNGTYIFLGYPKMDERGRPFFEHGKSYLLIIDEYFYSRSYGKGEMAPVVVSPYRKKYVSYKMFYKDWQKVSNV